MRRIHEFPNGTQIDLGEIIAVHPPETQHGTLPGRYIQQGPYWFYFRIYLRGGESIKMHTGLSNWRETIIEEKRPWGHKNISTFEWDQEEILQKQDECKSVRDSLVLAWKAFHGQAD